MNTQTKINSLIKKDIEKERFDKVLNFWEEDADFDGVVWHWKYKKNNAKMEDVNYSKVRSVVFVNGLPELSY